MSSLRTGNAGRLPDSGKRDEFEGGGHRDTEDGRGRYDLIHPILSRRLAVHMQRGAEKYGEENWTMGIPTRRAISSLKRHIDKYLGGSDEEDHLAAVCFNAMVCMYNEEVQPQWDNRLRPAQREPEGETNERQRTATRV